MERQYLKATSGDLSFAVPTEKIEAVSADTKVFTMPFMPEGVCGIMKYKDEMIAILNLRGGAEASSELKIICRESNHFVAYSADSADGFIDLTEEQIRELTEKYDNSRNANSEILLL